MAAVLGKPRDRITFVLLDGGGDPGGAEDAETLPAGNGSGHGHHDPVTELELRSMESTFRKILEARDVHSPNTVVVIHLSRKFDEVMVRLTSGTQARQRRVIVAPAADRDEEPIVNAVATRCCDLRADGTGGARRCHLRPWQPVEKVTRRSSGDAPFSPWGPRLNRAFRSQNTRYSSLTRRPHREKCPCARSPARPAGHEDAAVTLAESSATGVMARTAWSADL